MHVLEAIPVDCGPLPCHGRGPEVTWFPVFGCVNMVFLPFGAVRMHVLEAIPVDCGPLPCGQRWK
jgi:hypothetical protein